MRYTLRIDGVEFPGQRFHGGLDPQSLLQQQYGKFIETGEVSYLTTGNGDSVMVNWDRVTTVHVIVTDEHSDA